MVSVGSAAKRVHPTKPLEEKGHPGNSCGASHKDCGNRELSLSVNLIFFLLLRREDSERPIRLEGRPTMLVL
jgi:hypothetical protein